MEEDHSNLKDQNLFKANSKPGKGNNESSPNLFLYQLTVTTMGSPLEVQPLPQL
jgi:hypothetical protein